MTTSWFHVSDISGYIRNDSYLGIMLLYHMCESIPGCSPTPSYFLGAERREWNEATFHLTTTDDWPTTLCITFCEPIFLIFNHMTTFSGFSVGCCINRERLSSIQSKRRQSYFSELKLVTDNLSLRMTTG